METETEKEGALRVCEIRGTEIGSPYKSVHFSAKIDLFCNPSD